MTDRELLEKAAKAAGVKILFQTLRDGSGQYRVVNVTGLPDAFNMNAAESWNPLDDDGQALRLAIDLELIISTGYGMTAVAQENNEFAKDVIELHHLSDPYAATRRAIVRAAAAIGETL